MTTMTLTTKPNEKFEAQAKLDDAGEEAVLDMLREGKTLRAIALSLRVSRNAVWRWLEADSERSARAREARAEAGLAHVELASELLEDATDMFELSKARERAQHLRWLAACVSPAQYGNRTRVETAVGPTIEGIVKDLEAAAHGSA